VKGSILGFVILCSSRLSAGDLPIQPQSLTGQECAKGSVQSPLAGA
jgi:hypothetical protein